MNKLLCALFLGMASLSVQAATTVVNSSFETNNVGSGYLYANWGVQADGWSFTDTAGGAGISANGTGWHGQASDGNYFAFLQNVGLIKQTIKVESAADLAFSFDLAQRSAWNSGGAQTVAVTFDDLVLGTFTPYTDSGWDTWTRYSVAASNVTAGEHVLSFVGLNPNKAYDTAVFLDAVALSVTPVPEPETYAMLLVGLGAVGCLKRRKLKQTAAL
jgi:PEP-CTERM putative exosortase interaction domain